MAKTSTATTSVTIVGDGMNYAFQPQAAISNPASPGYVNPDLVLSAGFNSVALPPGTTWWMLVFAATSTNPKTLKGLTGDTGIAIAPNQPLGPFPVPSSVTAIGITATAQETATLICG